MTFGSIRSSPSLEIPSTPPGGLGRDEKRRSLIISSRVYALVYCGSRAPGGGGGAGRVLGFRKFAKRNKRLLAVQANENFITFYIVIFYYCGICLLLEPRLVEVHRFYLQSWFHVLVLNVANKCSKYIRLRYRGAQLLLTPPSCMDGGRRAWTVCYGIGLGTNAWIRRFQDGGCSTLYSPISTQIASSSSARGFIYSVDIFFYIFSYVPGGKDALRAKNSLKVHVM